MTSSTSGIRRLLTTSTAVLALLLLVLGTVLMHSVIGHSTAEHTMSSTTAMSVEHAHAHAHAEGLMAAASHSDVPVLTSMSGAGCDGLCGLMCSLMGMACIIVIALFAWAMLRPRTGGLLHLLARLIALAAHHARRVAVPRPPSLTALQIIRI